LWLVTVPYFPDGGKEKFMSRTLSWKWLCSRSVFQRGRVPARVRPCLAAVEQLEDRVLLTATFVPPLAPIPLSQQSLNAVAAFITEQGRLFDTQDTIIQRQNDLINQTADKLPTNVVNFFLKIDADLAQIDNDFQPSTASTTGTAGTTSGTVGIDTVLTYLKLPLQTAINLESIFIPRIGQEVFATDAVMAQLQKSTPGVLTKAEGIKLEADVIELKTNSAAIALNFSKIEYEFIGADANDLGPALGPQASAPPGPAGGLLQDLMVLASDASPPGDLNNDGQADAFVKIQNTFIAGENAFLKYEQALMEKITLHHEGLYVGDADYFLKLDGDLIKINTDLAVSAAGTTAAAGVDNVLLNDANTLNLSQQTVKGLNALVQAVQSAGAEAATLEQEVAGATTSAAQPGLVDDKHKGEIEIWSWSWGVSFAEMETNFIKLDPKNFGAALGYQGSAALGPVGGLLQDSLVLATDAGGTFPGAIVYPPPTVVDSFLKFESAVSQNENSFLASEQGFLNLGVQLPAAIVDYFLKMDDAFLEMDTGLVGPSGTPPVIGGADGVLLTLGLPPAYNDTINKLGAAIQTAQQAATAAETALQKNSGGPATPAALQYFVKIDHIQKNEQTAMEQLSFSFLTIENEFIGLDPSNQEFGVQDSKNIADGAAKAQAVE